MREDYRAIAEKLVIGLPARIRKPEASKGTCSSSVIRYRSSSSSIACISLRAWLLPPRAAQAMPAFSRSIASGFLPAPASVCAAMK